MGRLNGHRNGYLPKENGFEATLVNRTGSMPEMNGSLKQEYDVASLMEGDDRQRFLQRISAGSQESGKSHSSSEDAPKSRWKLMSRGKKEKKEKGLKHAAEKEGAPERASKGRWSSFLTGAKAAERSGPSSSSPSASSPSKLSDSSDGLVAADITEGSGKALLKPREEPGLAALATGRIDQSAEAVQSPPVATSGCLGMFKRVKSEEVTIRGLSQPFLTAEPKADRRSGERLPPRTSRRSTETLPQPIGNSNGSHDSTSSAVSSRRSSFEEVHAPAADSETQAPHTSGFFSRLVSSPFAAASLEADTPAAGHGVEGKDASGDSATGPEGRTQSSDGSAAKNNDQGGKKGHRRVHSLGSYLPSWVVKRTASIPSNLDKAVEAHKDDDKTPPSPKTPRSQTEDAEAAGASAEPPAVPPKTPELTRNQSALSCFGLGGKVATGEDGDEQVENSKGSKGNDADAMPSGSVGLRNIGNTCFINSALQVLRWTPGFAELLVPDLLSGDFLPLSSSARPAEESTRDAAVSALPATSSQMAPLSLSAAAASAEAEPQAAAAAPEAVEGGLSSGCSAQEDPVSSAAMEDPAVLARTLDSSPVPSPLPTIRENSPALAETECLAPVRTKPSLEGHEEEDEAETEPAAEHATHSTKDAHALGAISVQQKSNVAPQEGSGASEELGKVQTEGGAKQGGSPLGPVTPAHSEIPFAHPSLASPPSSLWGHNSAHSDTSTGSAQAAEEPQLDVGGVSKGSAAEGVELAGLEEVVCACGMHTVGHLAGGSSAVNAVTVAAVPMAIKLPERKTPPLERGEMADAFRQLTKQVYSERPGAAVDPTALVKKLYQLPQCADFQDGGQHDCQEALRSILLGLHDDLNRVVKESEKPKAAPEEAAVEGKEQEAAQVGSEEEEESAPKQEASEVPKEEGAGDAEGVEVPKEDLEAAKADREWARHLAQDNSVIYDLFSGQLQSSIKCHKCNNRFTTYEVFLDLSVPLTKEGKGGMLNFFSKNSTPSIEDCLHAFTTDEVMQGDEAFQCEHCNERTSATKHFRIHRLPKVLLLHIKRFKYTGTTREKITTNVTFPLKNLSLQPFVSDESGLEDADTSKYELFAVSNHIGSITNGHYMAVCKAPPPPGAKDKDQWFCYSDDSVKRVPASAVPSPNAYLLCYHRKDAEAKAADRGRLRPEV